MMTLDEFIHEFAMALYTNSKMRFDNIGIDTLGYSLPSRMLVDDAWKKYVGLGWFGQWWMREVYPRLFPKQYAARRDYYLHARHIHDDDLMVYHIEQALSIARELKSK